MKAETLKKELHNLFRTAILKKLSGDCFWEKRRWNIHFLKLPQYFFLQCCWMVTFVSSTYCMLFQNVFFLLIYLTHQRFFISLTSCSLLSGISDAISAFSFIADSFCRCHFNDMELIHKDYFKNKFLVRLEFFDVGLESAL